MDLITSVPATRRFVSLLAAAAAAAFVMLGATEARAAGVGYLWSSSPSTPGSSTPDPTYSFSSAGGAMSVDRTATGTYAVTFAGLGDATVSDVQVTAYGVTANSCVVQDWYSPNGVDVVIDIGCYNRRGNLSDTEFTVLYQGTSQIGVVFLWADQPTAASYTPDLGYQYNYEGTNTVTRSGTGLYRAMLPGIRNILGTVVVSAYGGAAARCSVLDWNPGGGGTMVDVACTDGAGNPSDQMFDLVYSREETAGWGVGSTNGGAILAKGYKDHTSYTPEAKFCIQIDGEPMTVQRNSKGSYTWTMTVDSTWASDTVLVTAYGAAGNYCNTSGWGSSSTVTQVGIQCYDGAGDLADTMFTATFQLAGVY